MRDQTDAGQADSAERQIEFMLRMMKAFVRQVRDNHPPVPKQPDRSG